VLLALRELIVEGWEERERGSYVQQGMAREEERREREIA
jgi:hypothetical protein